MECSRKPTYDDPSAATQSGARLLRGAGDSGGKEAAEGDCYQSDFLRCGGDGWLLVDNAVEIFHGGARISLASVPRDGRWIPRVGIWPVGARIPAAPHSRLARARGQRWARWIHGSGGTANE